MSLPKPIKVVLPNLHPPQYNYVLPVLLPVIFGNIMFWLIELKFHPTFRSDVILWVNLWIFVPIIVLGAIVGLIRNERFLAHIAQQTEWSSLVTPIAERQATLMASFVYIVDESRPLPTGELFLRFRRDGDYYFGSLRVSNNDVDPAKPVALTFDNPSYVLPSFPGGNLAPDSLNATATFSFGTSVRVYASIPEERTPVESEPQSSFVKTMP